MKKLLLLLMTIFLSSMSWADTIQDTVYSVDRGENGQETLIKFMNGRVAFIDEKDLDEVQNLMSLEGQKIRVEVDNRLTVQSLTTLPQDEKFKEENSEELLNQNDSNKMVPTIIPSWSQALTIWRGMNRSYKSQTECTDRAHVWAYEEWKKYGLNSTKTFLFFTNTYIRAYRYNWWFHVSPSALISEYGKDVEHIFDRRYASMPLHMKTWTDIFIRSKRSCPSSTYRFYRNNRNGSEHCFVVRADMFYRLPLHVRNLEDYGTVKTQFSNGEVNFSYRAFTRRL